jgi:hypothetical protein
MFLVAPHVQDVHLAFVGPGDRFEILDARKRFNDPQVLRQVILEDIGLATA